MFFFPYRVDLPLGRIPFLTIIISLLCILTYYNQVSTEEQIQQDISEFCQQQTDRKFAITLSLVKSSRVHNCAALFNMIHNASDADEMINQLARVSRPIRAWPRLRSQLFVKTVLSERYDEIRNSLPQDLTTRMAYRPDSPNLLTMFTSQLAHGDIGHLLGNLLFFFAFAASLEIVLGGIRFSILAIVLSIGVSLAYSASTYNAMTPMPTIGLSGVVAGMIGLFSYLMPSAHIRCLFVFFVYIRVFLVPAWLLAAWFIGWDIYDLFIARPETNVNLVAHVSGAVFGYFMGMLFLSKKKQLITEHLKNMH